jgi:transcriptional regulator with XRE-family HTH domain
MADSGENVLAERIERLRRERDLTVEELAARGKVDPALFESLPDAVPDIEVPVLGRLAEALGVELGDLLEGIRWVPDEAGGDGEYRVEDLGGG